MLQVEEVESLEARITEIQKAAKRLPEARQVAADLEVELTAIAGAAVDGESYARKLASLTFEPNVIRSGIQSAQVVRSSLRDLDARRETLERELSTARERIAAGKDGDSRVAYLREQIALRKAQINRLHGGMIGRLTCGLLAQPYGSNPNTCLAAEAEFICSQILAEHAGVTSTRRRVAEESAARWSLAVEQLTKWREVNEAGSYGVRVLRVGFDAHGSRECSQVYRILLNREGNRDFWKCDRHAQFLFVPFDSNRVSRELEKLGSSPGNCLLIPNVASFGDDRNLTLTFHADARFTEEGWE